MTITNPLRVRARSGEPAVGPQLVLIGALAAILTVGAVFHQTMSGDALLPGLSTLFFIMAAVVALIAWQRPVGGAPFFLLGRGRHPHRDRHRMAAAVEPEQMVRLVAGTDRSPEGRPHRRPPASPAGAPGAASPFLSFDRGSRGPLPAARRFSQIIVIDFVLAGETPSWSAWRHRACILDARQGDLLGGRGRGGATHPVRGGRHSIADHRRAHARRRHPAALGVLEDVSRDHLTRTGPARVRGSRGWQRCRPWFRP